MTKKIKPELLSSINAAYSAIEPKVNGEIVFLSLVGSHAYGLAHENSDVDVRGVYLAPMKTILSTEHIKYTYTEIASEYDIVVQELSHFAWLALKANPNILEFLYGPPIYISEPFRLLVENRSLFLSQGIRTTFIGAARSSFSRISPENTESKNYKHALSGFRLISMCKNILESETLDLELKDKEIDATKYMASQYPANGSEGMNTLVDLLIEDLEKTETNLPEEPAYDDVNQIVANIRMHTYFQKLEV